MVAFCRETSERNKGQTAGVELQPVNVRVKCKHIIRHWSNSLPLTDRLPRTINAGKLV